MYAPLFKSFADLGSHARLYGTSEFALYHVICRCFAINGKVAMARTLGSGFALRRP